MPFCAFAGSSTFTGLKYRAMRSLGVLVGGADDPQHEKKSHHRGHEIGERDFPGAAVMLLFVRAMALDDDDFGVSLGHRCRSGLERGKQLGPGAKFGDDLRRIGLDDGFYPFVFDILDLYRQIDDLLAQESKDALGPANLD